MVVWFRVLEEVCQGSIYRVDLVGDTEIFIKCWLMSTKSFHL